MRELVLIISMLELCSSQVPKIYKNIEINEKIYENVFED